MTADQTQRGRTVRRIATIVAVLSAVAIFFVGRNLEGDDLIGLVRQLQGYGRHWWAPAALIGAMIVVNLTGLPGTPLTIAAGAVWGFAGGASWMMVATMIATAVPYALARMGLRRLRERLAERHARAVEWIGESGFSAVAILRLVHIFPFAVISYASGIAGVRAGQYFAGTFVGTLPGVLVWTYMADSIVAGVLSPDEAKRRIVIAALLLAALIGGSSLIARRMRRGFASGQSKPHRRGAQ